MNSKKAKAIRQLVKHLQNRGAIENNNWNQYLTPDQLTDKSIMAAILDPSCGRAVYQQMKKRASTGRAK